MPDLSAEHAAIASQLVNRFGRATLPVQRADSADHRGTAFWFADRPSGSGRPPGSDRSHGQYLLTATNLTYCDLGELLLREALCDPPSATEALLLPGFGDLWRPAGDPGVAAMPTAGLHAHGARMGWRWSIDEITCGHPVRRPGPATAGTPTPGSGTAPDIGPPGEDGEEGADGSGAADTVCPAPGAGGADLPDPGRVGDGPRVAGIAVLDARPATVFVLGHAVRAPAGRRPQAVLVACVHSDRTGPARLVGPVPDGFVGAPVFGAAPGPDRVPVPRCLGVLLPDGARHRVAPLGPVRRALRDLPAAPDAPRRRWSPRR